MKKITKLNSIFNDIDKKSTRALYTHFKLSRGQMLIIIWLKGLWTGLIISLIIHHFISH